MSTLPHPPSDGPRAEQPLSERERAALDDIAGHENAGDPGFVARLGAAVPEPRRTENVQEAAARARRRDLTIQGAAVVGLAALLMPAAWFVAAVVTVVLILVPLVLLGLAWRDSQQQRARLLQGRVTDHGADGDEATGPAR